MFGSTVATSIYLLYLELSCSDKLRGGAVDPEHTPREMVVVLVDEVNDWLGWLQSMETVNQL